MVWIAHLHLFAETNNAMGKKPVRPARWIVANARHHRPSAVMRRAMATRTAQLVSRTVVVVMTSAKMATVIRASLARPVRQTVVYVHRLLHSVETKYVVTMKLVRIV